MCEFDNIGPAAYNKSILVVRPKEDEYIWYVPHIKAEKKLISYRGYLQSHVLMAPVRAYSISHLSQVMVVTESVSLIVHLLHLVPQTTINGIKLNN